MFSLIRQRSGWSRARMWFGALAALGFAVVLLAAHSPAHAMAHAHEAAPSHNCVLCLLAHGQAHVDPGSAHFLICPPASAFLRVSEAAPFIPASQTVCYPERGPPVFFS